MYPTPKLCLKREKNKMCLFHTAGGLSQTTIKVIENKMNGLPKKTIDQNWQCIAMHDSAFSCVATQVSLLDVLGCHSECNIAYNSLSSIIILGGNAPVTAMS